MTVRRVAVVVVAASVVVGPSRVSAAESQAAPARFVTVDQGADELKADEALARSLGSQLIGSPDQQSYEEVIATLLGDARTGGVVARVTPYAFVVAEMRGAKVELLATCVSRSTGKT